MSNPWLKKNPFMSMWLSGANKIAGSVRSQVAAEAKRQISHTLAQATEGDVKVVTRPRAKAKAKTLKR